MAGLRERLSKRRSERKARRQERRVGRATDPRKLARLRWVSGHPKTTTTRPPQAITARAIPLKASKDSPARPPGGRARPEP